MSRIRLREAQQADVDSLAPELRVLVGVEEVPLEWWRVPSGDESRQTWRARVPARATTEPTVVRVLVGDGHGAELGRAFIEVAARPRTPPASGAALPNGHSAARVTAHR